MKFNLEEAAEENSIMPKIMVIGLGGGGGNAVDFMVRSEIVGVDFVCANTDAQALKNSLATSGIQLGKNGLGAGADPEKGAEAAQEDIEQVKAAIAGVDMLFITAGMGGGTGTGSAPVVAKAARELGILTVGIVSKPFSFERRGKVADAGIAALGEHVDSLITVPNDKLLKILGRDFALAKAFDYSNEILHGAVQGISELLTNPGFINVDFMDLRTVMSERGVAMMGVGHASGDDRATKAAQKAIENPLLEDVSVTGARGLLINITCGNMTMGDFQDVGEVIDGVAGEDTTVIIGTSLDETMDEEIRVTVIATGLTGESKAEKVSVAKVEAVAKPVIAPAVQAPVAESTQISAKKVSSEPEVVRPKMVVNGSPTVGSTSSDYLDIPAFLRRQAD